MYEQVATASLSERPLEQPKRSEWVGESRAIAAHEDDITEEAAVDE
jgi:hypothetical protein